MLTSSVKYRKCTYTTYCHLKSPQLPTEDEMSKYSNIRYISEVDERLGIFVRLYAIVECSVPKIKPEMLIEQIRALIFPLDRTFGNHPINNIGNDSQLAGLLGAILTSFDQMFSQACNGQKKGIANVAIILIRGNLILYGVLGDIIIALLRKNADSYARRASSQQYTIFSNCNTSQARINNSTTGNSNVRLYLHEIRPADFRLFIFNRESIRMLLTSVPSLTLFAKSPDDLTWILHLWQAELYSKDPNKVPAVGFILVDNLSKIIEDNGNHLTRNFVEQLLKSSERIMKQQAYENETKNEQKQKILDSKQVTQSSKLGKTKKLTNQCTIDFLQKELKKILIKYNRITEFIIELLHQEWNEMSAFIKRKDEIVILQKECGQNMVLKETVLNLQQRQQNQLAGLQIFLRNVLKYQDIVGCELLINVEKLELKLNTPGFGADETYSRDRLHLYQRMRSITVFQTKIEQILEISQIQMQQMIKNSLGMQEKLDSLKSKIQRYKQSIEPSQGTGPMSGQIYYKGTRAHQAGNQRCDNGFSMRHWRRRPNNRESWNNNYGRNH